MEFGVSEYIVNAQPIRNRTDDHLWSPLSANIGGTASSGVVVSERSALGYPPLWRALNLIASSVAGLPFDVFKKQRDGGKKVDMKHPAQYLLNKKSSPYIQAYVMRKTMTALAGLHGNSFAAIDRVEGKPKALVLWDSQNTLVRFYEGELWYITYVNGAPLRVRGADMLHIRGLGGDGICGWPVIEIMKDALGVGMAAQQFGGRFFGQGSNMSGLLMIPGHFNEEKIRNTMTAWNSMQQGLTNAHKVALLQDGVKFQQLTVNPEQAQFLQTRDYEVRATVANITGVPPHMLGDSTRTSHNSLESEAQSYLDYTLQPWLKCWEAECEDKLLTEKQRQDDSHIIEFNREALIQMTFSDKVNGIKSQLEGSIISRNEARALLNLSSLGEEGDHFFQPANWIEAGSEPTTQATQAEDPSALSEPETTDNVLRSMITSTVTSNLKIERDRVVKMASKETANQYDELIDEFYSTWTETTCERLGYNGKTSLQKHAAESIRQLNDCMSGATTDSLRANVKDVVSAWESRSEILVNEIMKEVTK